MSEARREAKKRRDPVDPAAAKGGAGAWVKREIKETLQTAAIFIPLWLVFTTFFFELRSIPSESMVPSLQVGDRVAVTKFAYGYNRNSIPYGIGRMLGLGDGMIGTGEPQRGQVAVFLHPRQDKVMIKRIVGVPGDAVQVRSGRLWVNGEPVERDFIRRTRYIQHRGGVREAREFNEVLPGGAEHLIHEFDDMGCLDKTPEFIVPDGHYFMMGDNRDNSEDSRAPSGHPVLAAERGDEWGCVRALGFGEPAVGFVPRENLIGRADTVLFTLNFCRKRPGLDCPAPRLWRGL